MDVQTNIVHHFLHGCLAPFIDDESGASHASHMADRSPLGDNPRYDTAIKHSLSFFVRPYGLGGTRISKLMQKSGLKEQVIRHFHRHLGQFQPRTAGARVFQKLDPEMVFQLLDTASIGCNIQAKELLRKMSTAPWTITASPKEGGFVSTDKLHFSLDVPINNRAPAYHCYCHEIPGGLYVYRITQKKPSDA